MDRTRVVIIGAGSDVAADHHGAFQSLSGVEVVAAVDTAVDARARAASQWRVPVYPTVADLANAGQQVDLAVVCVRDVLHAEIAGQALAAGWHTLVEKPMTTSLAEARALFDDAAVRGLYLAVGLQRRYQTRALCKFRPLLGDVREVHAHWRRYRGMPHWRAGERKHGGVIADLAVHLFSQAEDVLAAAAPVRVTARAPCKPRGRVEDAALVLVDYDDGALLTVSVAYDRLVTGLRDETSLHVIGAGAEVDAPLLTVEDRPQAYRRRPVLSERTNDGPTRRRVPRLRTVPECHRSLAEDVVRAVRQNRSASREEVRRELRLMALVEAAYGSLDAGGDPITLSVA
jgi:predicted dehydrogenase